MTRCRWCNKQRVLFSDVEQQHPNGEWSEVCAVCLRHRRVADHIGVSLPVARKRLIVKVEQP